MADSSDESVGEKSVLQVNKRKQPEKWKRNVRKEKRNKGEEYVSLSGKVVSAVKLGPECTCKNKCFSKIGNDNVSDFRCLLGYGEP